MVHHRQSGGRILLFSTWSRLRALAYQQNSPTRTAVILPVAPPMHPHSQGCCYGVPVLANLFCEE